MFKFRPTAHVVMNTVQYAENASKIGDVVEVLTFVCQY